MIVKIDEFCKNYFLIPFNIPENDVISTLNNSDNYHKIKLDWLEFYLHVKKISDYYILIRGIWLNGEFRVDEVYKLFSDIIGEKDAKAVDLIKILAKFYEIVGYDIDVAGTKAKFLFNYGYIGIPKLPPGNHAKTQFTILNKYVKILGLVDNIKIAIQPAFNVKKGIFVDFVHVLLLYALDPNRYRKYLIEKML